MKITKRNEEGVAVWQLDGRLTIGDGDVALREHIDSALADGDRKILLDLGRVRLMDSSGLGELVRAKSTSESQGATIKLLNVENKVEEVLSMTRLIGVFETYEDEIDAIASFRG